MLWCPVYGLLVEDSNLASRHGDSFSMCRSQGWNVRELLMRADVDVLMCPRHGLLTSN